MLTFTCLCAETIVTCLKRYLHTYFPVHWTARSIRPIAITTFLQLTSNFANMPYLVGNLIKEIEAGGPITSFPKSSKAQKENKATPLDDNNAETATDDETTILDEEPQEDWVKKKWARYYEVNQMGYVKPNFNKMTFPQFQQYMEDALEQGRPNTTAAMTRLGFRNTPVQELRKRSLMITETSDQGQIQVVAPAAEPQTVAADTESRPRKKPRVKAHITKEQYLNKH